MFADKWHRIILCTGGFCRGTVLLPACPCWWQPVHSSWGKDDSLLNSHRTYSVEALMKIITQTINVTGIEQIQALADILCLALCCPCDETHAPTAVCCHSNEIRAPIANPPDSAQLQGTLYHSPKLHPGLCNNVGMWQWTDRHTDGRDHYTSIHFASSTTHVKCNNRTLARMGHSRHQRRATNLCGGLWDVTVCGFNDPRQWQW